MGRSPRAGRAVALLVAVGALVGACSGDDLGDRARAARSSTTVAPLQEGATSTTVDAVGQALVVEDNGVTSFTDRYAGSSPLGSYGVVLRNPDPTLMATGVRVRTRILDAAGTELLADTAFLNGIMPGARMAVGRTIIEPISGPAQLSVSIDVSDWIVPVAPTPLVAEAPTTEADLYGGAATRFGVRSELPGLEEGVDVTAVYRDASGRLLGAEQSTLSSVPPGQTVLGQIPLISPIPGTASTEVFVGRGFAAQTTG